MQQVSGKLLKTAEEGHPVVNQMSSLVCNGCGNESHGDICQCAGCKSVKYCNQMCQKGHWSEHKVLCAAIQQLQKDSVEKCKRACSFESHLTPAQKQKIVKLVGERCLIGCQISGKQTKALWDTGSQICLISMKWLVDNGLDVKVEDLSTLIGRDLHVEGVGGFTVPYEGYVILDFSVDNAIIQVPFLVTKERLECPIIGYNVISIMANDSNALCSMVKQSGENIDEATVSSLVEM